MDCADCKFKVGDAVDYYGTRYTVEKDYGNGVYLVGNAYSFADCVSGNSLKLTTGKRNMFTNLTNFEKMLRANIRNAWLAESVEALKVEADNRGSQNKWFEAAVLLELAVEVAQEGGVV